VRLFTWPYNPKRFGVIKKLNQLVLECDTQLKACASSQTSKQIAEFLKNTRESRDSHAMSDALGSKEPPHDSWHAVEE